MSFDQTYDDDASSAIGALTAAAALAGVLLWSLGCVTRTHRARVAQRTLPERLQTWETEGGRPTEAGDVTQPTMR